MAVDHVADAVPRSGGIATLEAKPLPSRGVAQAQSALAVPLELEPLPSRPLVSVLIANYNYASYVGQAIESALGQTYGQLEVVVCDDGSTDDSRQVIAAYAARDPRVRLITRANGGLAAALNSAYGGSRGDVLCLLDSDDVFLPSKVEAIVERFARQPRTGLVVHPLLVTDQLGRGVQRIPVLTKVEEGWIAERVLRRGGRWRSVPTSGISFRRTVADYAFPIPEEPFRTGADGFVAMLLPLIAEVGVAPETLSRYRVHGQNEIGGFGFDGAVVRRVTDLARTTSREVNNRLCDLGLPGSQIDDDRNVSIEEYSFLTALANGAPRLSSVRRYGRYARLIARSDLYGCPQKTGKAVFMGVAVVLPVRLRARWFAVGLGHNRAKYVAQRALTVLRRAG